MDHQDAFWVERARRGDHAAFGLLVDKYATEITRFLASKIGRADEAHDLAQDTWLHMYLSLGRLREPGKFREWVYGIARNRALMWLRQARNTATLPETITDKHVANASSDDLIAVWELREAVLHAITQLSDINREAVRMHYLDDLSYREIAERLNVPVKTVKSRLHKARQQLKPHLQAIVELPATATKEETTMIEATIYAVYLVERADNEETHTIVVLKARNQSRYLPIWVGQPEAEGIAARLRSLTTKRPLTYDLMAQLVDRLGGSVEAVHLQTLRDEVFYATLHIQANGTSTQIDCRPSDALALAIRVQAPILIADDMLAQAGSDNATNFANCDGAPQIEAVQPLQLELFKHGGTGTYSIYQHGT